MGGGEKQLTRVQQEEIKLDVRQELTSVQNRDDVPDESIDRKHTSGAQRLIRQEREENTSLVAHVMESYQQETADQTAAGTPQAELKPAKKSFKQRREEKKRAKEARKHTPAGDHVSWAAQRDLAQRVERRDNSVTPELQREILDSGVDVRVVRSFVQGHRTNARGEPLDREQQDIKQKDETFIRDYISGDLERRRPHLERITQEMVSFEMNMDMFTDEYLETHTAELKGISDRMTYFQNVMNDPVNASFFENLPPLEKKLLDARWSTQCALFGTMLVNRLAMKGVALDAADYCEEAKQTERAVGMHQPLMVMVHQTITERRQKTEEAYREQRELQTETLSDEYAPDVEETVEETIGEDELAVEEITGSYARRTRQEATNTPSDQLSRQRRDQVADFENQLKTDSPLRAALESYRKGTRYDVGYTEERRRLQVALRELNKALGEVTDEAVRQTLLDARRYFDEMTNGTLQVPEGAQVQDFTREQPAEVGSIQRGSFRNGVIRRLSRWSNQKDTPLFSHEPTVNDLKQRMVSNCYMVAGTAGLVNLDPALLKGCLRDNGDGTVTVRLYEKYIPEEEKQREAESRKAVQKKLDDLQAKVDSGEVDEWDQDGLEQEIMKEQYRARQSYRPVYAKVTKEVPRIGGADALSAGALWMQMIEKACACIGRDGIKGYQSLWYGEGGGFLERLLGVEPESVGTTEQDLFEKICSCRENRAVYNAGTGGNVGDADGLNTGHAYTVMGGKQVGDKRYVLLRNPYSTMSLQYEENGQKSRTGKHLASHSDETYGQFYMEFEEFLQKFQKITRTDLSNLPG